MMMTYSERIRRFQEALEGSADLAFIPVSADLQYLSGVPRDFPNYGALRYPGGWLEGLWLTAEVEPVLTLTRMTADFHNPDTSSLTARVLGDFEDPAKLVGDVLNGFHLQDKPRVAVGDLAHAETIVGLGKILPGVKYSSATELLRPQRMIKDDEELALMKRAGEITEAAFVDVLTKLQHGMKEMDILSEVDYQLRRHGGFGPSFTSAVYCVGPEHEIVFGGHQSTWQRELHPPVSILFDFGAIHEGYCYDFGRTVVFGEPDEAITRVHELVMASQAAGIKAMWAGQTTAAEVDAAARSVIEEAGLGEAFRHRLGHSIGLDVHEAPFLTQSDQTFLEQGMLFTVEPSIIIENKLSARVEDVVLVGEEGGEPLTRGFQRLIVID